MAVGAIKDSGVPFPGKLILCHPVDERMMAGIKGFIERGHAEGVDGAVICEPEENQLCVKQKGALRVEVTVRGKMAHGAMPLSGVNPVTRAARFVVAVEEIEREEIERHGEDPFLGYPSLTPTILLDPTAGSRSSTSSRRAPTSPSTSALPRPSPTKSWSGASKSVSRNSDPKTRTSTPVWK